MASEKIVSPGVFTRENDLSFLPKGLSEIGAVVIGRTPKGAAYKPTVVSSFGEFREVFGEKNTEYFVPYMVDEYLRNAGTLTVVRVLGNDSFSYNNVAEIVSGSTLLAVIRPTVSASGVLTASISGATANVSMSSFTIQLGDTAGETTYSNVSLNPTDSNYLGKLIGENPKGNGKFYVDHIYYEKISQSLSSGNRLIPTGSILSATSAVISTTGFITPQSPMVISQTYGAATNHELFRFYTLGDGEAHNKDIKISIFNIKPSGSIAGSHYGAFSIMVRKFSDTDKNAVVLETFNDLTLDKDSPNYIAKRIGDQYTVTNSDGKIIVYGEYPNLSKYIRVSMADLTSVPNDAVPFGFKNYYKYNSTAPDIKYKVSQSIDGNYSSRVYLGVDFEHPDCGNYHTFLPTNKSAVSTNFLLSNCALYDTTTNTFSGNISLTSSLSFKQFSFGFQLGFDGVDPRKHIDEQMTITTATSSGSVAYVKAIDCVKNPDEFDFNMMVLPELNYRLNSYVLKYALDVCEDRGDAFLILDAGPKSDSISTVIETVKSIDSSYAATYYPWLKIYDEANTKNVWVPPSVVLPGVVAFTDRVAHEWYAPAGSTRGGLTRVLQAYERLSKADCDELYSARINPIKSFPDVGIAVWGQKTLQSKASALDRVNIRRLLIKIKKLVASASRYLVFEQNNEETWNKFKAIVNPILDNIVVNNGLQSYKVVMDASTNTPDIIDRNMMKGAVILQPTKSAEYIVIDFNILPTGASFE